MVQNKGIKQNKHLCIIFLFIHNNGGNGKRFVFTSEAALCYNNIDKKYSFLKK